MILDIESPGGSPVQSDLIAGHDPQPCATGQGVRVHAVIREVGASGGYWIACAADEIHANPMSIVGSIGVVGGGFGFPDLLGGLASSGGSIPPGPTRLGWTRSARKSRRMSRSPSDLMEKLHGRFKDWVRTRRGRRLRAPEDSVFDGGYMLGEQAVAAGLIDGLSTVEELVASLAGERARARRIAPKRPRLALRLPRLAVDALLDAVEERAWRIDLR